jgi:hypothetical protein
VDLGDGLVHDLLEGLVGMQERVHRFVVGLGRLGVVVVDKSVVSCVCVCRAYERTVIHSSRDTLPALPTANVLLSISSRISFFMVLKRIFCVWRLGR